MNLLEQTTKAAGAVALFRHPDLGDWTAWIDPIIEAAGQEPIGNGTVTDIKVTSDYVIITHEVVRGIDRRTETSVLSMTTIQSADPIVSARRDRLERDLREANDELYVARLRLNRAEMAVEKLQAQIASLCWKNCSY